MQHIYYWFLNRVHDSLHSALYDQQHKSLDWCLKSVILFDVWLCHLAVVTVFRTRKIAITINIRLCQPTEIFWNCSSVEENKKETRWLIVAQMSGAVAHVQKVNRLYLFKYFPFAKNFQSAFHVPRRPRDIDEEGGGDIWQFKRSQVVQII